MTLPTDDRGLLLGDGLFETLLAIDGRLICCSEHLARMAAGCEVLGLPAPDMAAARRLMEDALASAGVSRGRAAVRLTLTAGSGGRGLERPATTAPRLFATASSAPAPGGPAMLTSSTVRRNEGSPASRLKTLSYLDNVLARRQALEAGADEAVMLNTRGEVACAAAANLFWLKNDRLMTPALDCGVLDGIIRARVLAWAARNGLRTSEVRADLADLVGADAAVLTNSLIGLRPVARLDDRIFEGPDLSGLLKGALAA